MCESTVFCSQVHVVHVLSLVLIRMMFEQGEHVDLYSYSILQFFVSGYVSEESDMSTRTVCLNMLHSMSDVLYPKRTHHLSLDC